MGRHICTALFCIIPDILIFIVFWTQALFICGFVKGGHSFQQPRNRHPRTQAQAHLIYWAISVSLVQFLVLPNSILLSYVFNQKPYSIVVFPPWFFSAGIAGLPYCGFSFKMVGFDGRLFRHSISIFILKMAVDATMRFPRLIQRPPHPACRRLRGRRSGRTRLKNPHPGRLRDQWKAQQPKPN